MLPACFLTGCIHLPRVDRYSDLLGNQVNESAVRLFVCGKHLARVVEVDHQNGDAETVVTSTMLPHKGKVIARERDQPNQLALILWEGEQLKSFCGDQQFAAGHVLECSEYGGFQDGTNSPRNAPVCSSEVSHNLS